MNVRTRTKRRLIIPFLLPAGLIYLFFFVYPVIRSLYISLLDWSGFTAQGQFVGLENFAELPTDDLYFGSLLNSFGLLFVGGIIVFAFSFFFVGYAMPGARGRGLFRAIIFLPTIIPLVAISLIWGFIYNPNFGLLSGFFRVVGLSSLASIPWMGPDLIRFSTLIAISWAYIGFYTILLMAGADRIPTELLDAAKVEGANGIQVFFGVTLPLLWDIVLIALVFWVFDALGEFEFVFMMTQGTGHVPRNIWTLPLYIYYKAFGTNIASYELGASSAMAVTMVIMIVILIVFIRKLLARETIQY